ncbi:MAG: transcriptional repressor [Eubacteriales bacterium]|nr:transcriptional repressor [Eubacteriales bacterium]
MNSPRHTLQREVVLQEIFRIQGHATADMIYDRIHASYPSISRATVYRNLKILVGQGKVIRINVPDGADYFEAKKQDHYHIKCNCCGRIFDASLPYMPRLLEMEQAADKDFELFTCKILFEGHCPDCKENHSKLTK